MYGVYTGTENPGMTRGRQADMAEQGMLGLSNFMAMGGNFNEFLVRMNPQRALGAGSGLQVDPSDIAAIKKSGMFGQLPSSFASAGLSPEEPCSHHEKGCY